GETEAAATARHALLELDGLRGADPAVIAQADGAARAWADGGGALTGDDLELALRLAASGGDSPLLEALHDRLVTSADRPTRVLLVHALAAVTGPVYVDRVLAIALTDALDPFERVELLGGLLDNPAAQSRAWDAIVRSPASLSSHLPPGAWPLLAARTGVLCTAPQRTEVEAAFAAHARDDENVALALADALESIDACIARRAHHAPGVATSLSPPAAPRSRGAPRVHQGQ
ncbi:MAG TPA: ERAP1-like C-terminal domain-containing protein, partial [Kofleriaceae bacterium]|nr:ERAP1-like C-terminal domain-containing protein [Kofleriaceae bacterium]